VPRDLDLIRLFDFYLALAFLVSTAVRIRQYEAIIRLVRAVPGRWPKLFALVKQHHTIFLTWSTVMPAALALGLFLIHTLAYNLVLHTADSLTLGRLAELWMAWPVVLVFGLAMLAVDGYATFTVGAVDRHMLEKYFDQAEYWLRSWAAPVVRVFTFGYVNPRKMVAVEVQKALVEASQLLNTSLWWTNVQVGLRIAFGASLWLTWAIAGG
jgi:hypothetical protein